MVSYKSLVLNDSSGASPKLHGSKAIGPKEQWNLSNADIDRSAPRNLHLGLNKGENGLKTDDIKGAKP